MMMVILAAIGLFALVALMSLLGGTVVWIVWPVVMVPVFHMPELGWWQAVALTWICSILLKSSSNNFSKD